MEIRANVANTSAIEWTDATWNPVRGCAIVSKGCTNCYAMRQAHRSSGAGGAYEGLTKLTKGGPVWTGAIRMVPELLDWPLRRRKPLHIFVNSMSDLGHEGIPDDFLWSVLAIAALCSQHTMQILTKRIERLQRLLSIDESEALSKLCTALGNMLDGPWVWNEGKRFRDRIEKAISATMGIDHDNDGNELQVDLMPWPLPNVWLGVSVEDQRRADERLPLLRQTPAAVRFVSAEPLLGPIDLDLVDCMGAPTGDIHWVIVGGESGPGARPMHPDWARSLRDQCAAAGVPFFFKQWGEWVECYCEVHADERGREVVPITMRNGESVEDEDMIERMGERGFRAGAFHGTEFVRVGKKIAGRSLDGRTHDEYPA
jgi:protein gp37